MIYRSTATLVRKSDAFFFRLKFQVSSLRSAQSLCGWYLFRFASRAQRVVSARNVFFPAALNRVTRPPSAQTPFVALLPHGARLFWRRSSLLCMMGAKPNLRKSSWSSSFAHFDDFSLALTVLSFMLCKLAAHSKHNRASPNFSVRFRIT
jgi:hypothetical protein